MSQPTPAAAAPGVVSASGPARQPLQTYLGSAVRPAAVAPVAVPVAVAAPVATQQQPQPQQQLFGAPGGAPVPFNQQQQSQQQPLFGSPALSGLSAPASGGGGSGASAAPDLLSSLLTPQASLPRQYVHNGGQTGVFGEPLGAQAPQQQQALQQQQTPPPSQAQAHAHPQPQAFTFSPAAPLNVNTMTPSSSFTSPAQPSQSQQQQSQQPPQQQQPQPLAPLSSGSPTLAAPVRLEQTSDHPLSFSPSPMPPLNPSAASPPSNQAHNTVLAGPLGPLAPPPRALQTTQQQQQQPPLQPNTQPQQQPQQLPRTASGSAGATLPDGATAPPPSSAAGSAATSPRAVPYSPLMSTAAAQAYSATQLQQQQLQQLLQPAALASPGCSPEGGEKLSTLLQALFQGEPPPAKLAVFDVAAVPRNEQGLVALAQQGCWREVLKLAEALLDLKVTPAATPANNNAHAHAQTGPQATTTAATQSGDTATTTTTSTVLPPHMTYRLLHYYIAALVKLKKFEAAHATCQQRVGPLFSADKLYLSHPAHYPSAAAATTGEGGPQSKLVGNMLPFELQLLATELPHFLPAHPRTRQALDQSMKLLQFLRAQIARKRIEEAEMAATPSPAAVAPTATATDTPAGAAAAASVPVSRRASISEGAGGLSASSLSSSPFSLSSPHTLSRLTSAQLHSQLCVARLHVVNLCLSWASSLDIDHEQALAWLEELRLEDLQAAEAAKARGDHSLSAHQDPSILECMARVNMHLGDINTATALLAQARTARENRHEIEHVQTGLHQSVCTHARGPQQRTRKRRD